MRKSRLIRFICVLILTVILIPNGICQSNKMLDSLLLKIKNAESDTLRINCLLQIVKNFQTDQPETALIYANKALNKSVQAGYERGKAESHFLIGFIHSSFSNYEVALDHFYQAEKIYDSLKIDRQLATVYNRIGIIHYYQANYEMALTNYLNSMEIYEALDDLPGVSSLYNNIGVLYSNQKSYDRALEYHFKSLEIDKKLNNDKGISSSYNNIGEIYRDLGEYDQALDYYKKSLDIKWKQENKLGMSYSTSNIGTIYQYRKEYKKALEYLLKSYELKVEIGDRFGLAESCNSLASFYLETNDYSNCEKYYHKALEIGDEIGAPELKKVATCGLSKLFAKKGQYKKAYHYQKDMQTILETIAESENMKRITNLEIQYNFAKNQKQKEFEIKERELSQKAVLKRQKIFNFSLLGAVFFTLIIILVIFRNYRVKKRINKKLLIQKGELLKAKGESEKLLLNILPYRTASELKETGKATAKYFESATIMFSDFSGFTKLCEDLDTLKIIDELNIYFTNFDRIIQKYTIEKIKTIGDSYMCAGGVPYKNLFHPFEVVLAGLEMQHYIEMINSKKAEHDLPEWKLRIGINTGDVVTGVVGERKFAYDIWGDSVNVASRMEAAGIPGTVNISGSTYEMIKDHFECEYRGKIPAKNKGDVDMYIVKRLSVKYSGDGDGITPNDLFYHFISELKDQSNKAYPDQPAH